MTFSRKSSRIYMDEYDLDGACNVLAKRMASLPESREYDIRFAQYEGAYAALSIILRTDCLKTQQDFMTVFDSMVSDDSEAIYETNTKCKQN